MKQCVYFLLLFFSVTPKITATPLAKPTNHHNLSMEWLYKVASYSSYSLDIPEVRNNLDYYINMTKEQLRTLEELYVFKDKLQFNHTAKPLKKFLAIACCATLVFIFFCKAGRYHPSDMEAEMLVACAGISSAPIVFLSIAGLSNYHSVIDLKSRLKDRLIITRSILARLQDIETKMQQEANNEH